MGVCVYQKGFLTALYSTLHEVWCYFTVTLFLFGGSKKSFMSSCKRLTGEKPTYLLLLALVFGWINLKLKSKVYSCKGAILESISWNLVATANYHTLRSTLDILESVSKIFTSIPDFQAKLLSRTKETLQNFQLNSKLQNSPIDPNWLP